VIAAVSVMVLMLLRLFLILLIMHCGTCLEKYGIGELEIDIGQQEGLQESSSIPHETLQKILAGVENGNKDNIYYFGLLKMYGISVSKDIAMAAQNFERASSLGHKEGNTAYGVMLMSGNGVKQDLGKAMKYFQKGVELGDMVWQIIMKYSFYILLIFLSFPNTSRTRTGC
jgi:hypothetical protein